ncbi:hypothetical protein [Bifidobacterium sp. UTBIF-78]|uniref:hypothetical protein n=1 Tax=Bifidobacterium sp. UTBIF-78 TaxID=1465263 RepID=UPI002158E7C8|nr:hypothetical protein [Bifidobacterium sp. UTBIF-78]TPF93518.1 hypothetical protein BG22_07030 [Bifidobacterium sp. UTBIF-78]
MTVPSLAWLPVSHVIAWSSKASAAIVTTDLTAPALLADSGDAGNLKPVEALSLTGPLVAVIAVCMVLVVALIVLMVLLSRPARRPRRDASPRGAHTEASAKAVWRKCIDDVVAQHEAGTLTREDAFAQLARIAREFAGSVSGRELSSSTLTDLTRLNRTPANRQGLDTLRQTISALYPPEFADAARNSAARETSVRDAAEWVSNLVERWRS